MWLPMALGSGKFGTPWERMHTANACAPACLLFAVASLALLVGPEEPQAAIAMAQPVAASVVASFRGVQVGVRTWLVRLPSTSLYDLASNKVITPLCRCYRWPILASIGFRIGQTQQCVWGFLTRRHEPTPKPRTLPVSPNRRTAR
jgi:hypothetical protein